MPQDPPPPEAPGPPHPNIGMAGTVAFESEADFTVAQGTSNAENVAGMFKTSHEESNKATLYGIVERVRSGEIERTDSGIKYTDKQAEDELKIDLNKRKPKSIESYKFTEAKLTSDIKAQFKSDHVTTAQVQGEIKPPGGSNTKALSAMVKIVASGSQTSDDISQPDAMLQLGKSLQQSATDAQAHAVMEEIKSGELPFVNGIVLDEAKILQELFGRLTAELAAKDMKLKSLTTQVTAVVDFTAVDEQTMKVWEVLFDVRSGPTSGGNRIDPLIFDLNMDGKFDITGKNQTGDGELTGPTVQLTWIPTANLGGTTPQDTVQALITMVETTARLRGFPMAMRCTTQASAKNFSKAGIWEEDARKGNRAKIFNAQAKWVGEWVKDNWRAHGQVGRYYWSPFDQKEETEWMKAGSGDGFWFGTRTTMAS